MRYSKLLILAIFSVALLGTASAQQYDFQSAENTANFTGYFSQTTNAYNIDMSDDGEHFYIAADDQLHQYNLGTAWDISTATYSQSYTLQASVGTSGYSDFVEWADNGNKLLVGDGDNANAAEYTASTPYDASSLTYQQNFDMGLANVNDIEFGNGGTKAFVIDGFDDNIKEFDLGTAYDVTSYSQTDTFSPQGSSTPKSLEMAGDGEHFYTVVDSDVEYYTLSTAYDLSSNTLEYEHNPSAIEGEFDLVASADGTNFYGANGYFEGSIVQWSTPEPKPQPTYKESISMSLGEYDDGDVAHVEGSYFATVNPDTTSGELNVINADTGNIVATATGDSWHDVSANQNGVIAVAGHDTSYSGLSVYSFDASTETLTNQLENPYGGSDYTAIDVDSTGKTYAVQGGSTNIQVYDSSGNQIANLGGALGSAPTNDIVAEDLGNEYRIMSLRDSDIRMETGTDDSFTQNWHQGGYYGDGSEIAIDGSLTEGGSVYADFHEVPKLNFDNSSITEEWRLNENNVANPYSGVEYDSDNEYLMATRDSNQGGDAILDAYNPDGSLEWTYNAADYNGKTVDALPRSAYHDGTIVTFEQYQNTQSYAGILQYPMPEVETLSASNIQQEQADLNGNLTSLGEESEVDAYFEYRETGASSWTTTSTQTLSSTQEYSETVTGLSQGTEYEYRAAANYSGNTVTGSTVTFTTVAGQPPNADFSYSPTSPGIGETISFDGSSSSDPDGTVETWEWDWTSDGTYESTGQTASHSYSSTGTYDVTLRVTDNDGETDTTTQTVTVTDQTSPDATNLQPSGRITTSSPTISADFSDNEELDSFTLELKGEQVTSGSLSGTSDSHSYQTSSLATGSHTYTYTVEDAAGNTATASETFTVNEAPTASYTYSPSTPLPDETVNFDATDSTDDDGIQTYEWDWDNDGNYEATGQTASNSFSSTGDYTVTLRVKDTDGATDTYSDTVNVEDNTAPTISNGDVVDLDDGDSLVSPGQNIRIEAEATDNHEVDSVDASLFGNTYTLTDGNNDNIYDTETTVPSGTSDGNYNLQVTATDPTGNSASESYSSVITVDGTSPSISYTSNTPSDGATLNTDQITVEVTATDDNLESVTETFDGTSSSFNTVSGDTYTTTHTGLADGTYTFSASATDSPGNTASTSQRTVTIDTQPPQVSDIRLVDTVNSNGVVAIGETVRVEADISDSVSSVDADLFGQTTTLTDGDNDNTYDGTISVPTGQNDGSYSADVTTEDSAGNSETFTGGSIQVDNTAPTISNIAVPSSVTQGDTMTVSADITEDTTSTVNPEVSVFGTSYQLTQGSGSTYTVEIQVPYTQNTGDYTATISAEDEESNTASEDTPQFTVQEGDFEIGTQTITQNEWGEVNYTVPEGTQSIWFELEGANGGWAGGQAGTTLGGTGGYTEGNLTQVNTGDEIVVEIGEGGERGVEETTFGGGGAGHLGTYNDEGQGGGGTHVFLNPDTGSSSAGYDPADRILVAGGGAGGTQTDYESSTSRTGLPGGGFEGEQRYEVYQGETDSDTNAGGAGGGYYGGYAYAHDNSGSQGGTAYIDSVIQDGSTTSGEEGAASQQKVDGTLTMEVTRTDSTAPEINIQAPQDGEAVSGGSFQAEYTVNDPETDIVNHNVSFQGTTETDNTTFDYDQAGEFDVTFMAENSAGLVTEETVTITTSLAYEIVDTQDSTGDSFVASGATLIKYDENLNKEWTVGTEHRMEYVKTTEDYVFAVREPHETQDAGIVRDIIRINPDNGEYETVLEGEIRAMDTHQNRVWVLTPTTHRVYDDDSWGTYDGNFWSESDYHDSTDIEQDEGYNIEEIHVRNSETAYVVGQNPNDDLSFWRLEDAENESIWQVTEHHIDDGSGGMTPLSLDYFSQEDKLLVGFDQGEIREYQETDLHPTDQNPIYSYSSNVRTTQSFLDDIFVQVSTEGQRLNYAGSSTSSEQTWSYSDEAVTWQDLSVPNGVVTLVTDDANIYQENAYSDDELQPSIRDFTLSKTEAEAGSDIRVEVTTNRSAEADRVEVEGQELIPTSEQQGFTTWEGDVTVPSETGNHTLTASVYDLLGNQDDTATAEITVTEPGLFEPDVDFMEQIPAPLFIILLIMGGLFLYFLYRLLKARFGGRRRNPQPVATEEGEMR